MFCRDFIREPFRQKWKLARTLKLCFKCLGSNHSRNVCKKKGCDQCNGGHHKLLHFDVQSSQNKENSRENLKKQQLTVKESKNINPNL